MTGKNVKERIGLGGMDADRIREIMGEAPACPRKRRGTSGNDIIRPARKNGPMQPSVYGEEYLHGIAGVQRRSLHIPAALHRKLSILAGASRNGKVTLEGSSTPCLAASGRIQGNDGHDSGGVPARPGHKGSSPMTGDLPDGSIIFVSETIVFNF